MERTKRFAWVVFAILILSAIFVFGDSNTVDSQDSHGKVENNLPNSMKLVWSEEFNDDKNIAKFWTFEIGNGQKKAIRVGEMVSSNTTQIKTGIFRMVCS